MHARLQPFMFALGTVLMFAGCKPKVGDKCSGAGLPTCSDPGTALTCSNGIVTAMQCRGPKACTSNGTQVQCDNSLALAGDGCDTAGDVACGVDHKSALECQGGKFAVAETCKGARACEVQGDKISCDNDVADLDDPCRIEADYACTSDKLVALKCVAKKFQSLNTCRGKDGCRVLELPEEKKTDFLCDDSIAQENDACDTEGEEACSMDKTQIFRCKSAHFAKDHDCPGGCSFDEKGETFVCAPSAASGAAASAAKAAVKAPAAAKPAPKPTAKPASKPAVAKKAH